MTLAIVGLAGALGMLVLAAFAVALSNRIHDLTKAVHGRSEAEDP